MVKKHAKLIFLRDSLLATVFLFLFLLAGKLFLLDIKALNPLNIAITDFDLTDLGYSQFKFNETGNKDTSIVIVNIGNDDRSEIARKINVIRGFNPKVIALDITFPHNDNNLKGNIELKDAISKTPNIVSGDYFVYDTQPDKTNPDSLISSDPYFGLANKEGYLNLCGEKEFNTIRYFAPVIKSGSKGQLSFAAKIIEKYDFPRFLKLIKKTAALEAIHYTGGIRDYIVYDSTDIYENNQNLQFLKGKIVLLGFCNLHDGNADFLDKHFTPLNRSYTGRSLPDMYGVVVHANILSMILKKAYIYTIPSGWMYFLSFIFCFVHVLLLQYVFLNFHYWYTAISNVGILLSTISVFLLSLLLYFHFSIKIDDTILIIPIVLAVEFVSLYEMIAKFLHLKFKFESHFIEHVRHKAK